MIRLAAKALKTLHRKFAKLNIPLNSAICLERASARNTHSGGLHEKSGSRSRADILDFFILGYGWID
jgi:hypothetical protein